MCADPKWHLFSPSCRPNAYLCSPQPVRRGVWLIHAPKPSSSSPAALLSGATQASSGRPQECPQDRFAYHAYLRAAGFGSAYCWLVTGYLCSTCTDQLSDHCLPDRLSGRHKPKVRTSGTPFSAAVALFAARRAWLSCSGPPLPASPVAHRASICHVSSAQFSSSNLTWPSISFLGNLTCPIRFFHPVR